MYSHEHNNITISSNICLDHNMNTNGFAAGKL